MAKFLTPNIDSKGRIVRGVLGALLLLACVVLAFWHVRVALVLAGCAAFVLFEAARGWCFVRACGIKTKV
jgi:hypothetical protein